MCVRVSTEFVVLDSGHVVWLHKPRSQPDEEKYQMPAKDESCVMYTLTT